MGLLGGGGAGFGGNGGNLYGYGNQGLYNQGLGAGYGNQGLYNQGIGAGYGSPVMSGYPMYPGGYPNVGPVGGVAAGMYPGAGLNSAYPSVGLNGYPSVGMNGGYPGALGAASGVYPTGAYPGSPFLQGNAGMFNGYGLQQPALMAQYGNGPFRASSEKSDRK